MVGAYGDDTGGTNRGAAYLFDPAFRAVLATGDFEKDGTPTNSDNKLAAGTITVTATPTDAAGNTGTVATGTATYDPVVPTVVSGSTGYYTDSNLSTALSGSAGIGLDIYTKVTFSEIIGETAADDSTARPAISYTTGIGDRQYDIIASGTPADGDCVESGSGASRRQAVHLPLHRRRD